MPDWSSEEEIPQVDVPETWNDVMQTLVAMQQDKNIWEVLNLLEPPERDDLEKALASSVATMLAERIMSNPASVTSLPNPQLLVHTMTLGVLAGLIYAQASHMTEETNNEAKEEPDGSEEPAG